MNRIKILSLGKYLPKRVVLSEFFDKKFNLEKGTTQRKTGIKQRHYINDETLSQMGAQAALDAISKTNLKLSDIDCIVSASGVMQQPIPCTASLIQRELGLESSGIPCFDINATCLSFVVALDIVSHLIVGGRYKNVLIVSADIASVGIDEEDFKSSILFGDGAAAAVVSFNDEEKSGVMDFNFTTFSSGSDFTCIKGGLSYIHPKFYSKETRKDYLFHMDGMQVYELASKHLKYEVYKILERNSLSFDDIKLVIPHQAGEMAMRLIQRKLKIPNGKFLYAIENVGNTIASSIPLALNYAVDNKMLQKNDKIMLLGTSAGLSIGVMLIEW